MRDGREPVVDTRALRPIHCQSDEHEAWEFFCLKPSMTIIAVI